MTGKAYKRAMLGHLLVSSALTVIVMHELMPQTAMQAGDLSTVDLHDPTSIENCRLSTEQLSELNRLYNDVMQHKVRVAGHVVPVDNELAEGQLSCDKLLESSYLQAVESGLNLLYRLGLLGEQSRTAKLWLQYLGHVDS